MKYSEITEKTIQNDDRLAENLKPFDMSGKTVKKILSSYAGDPHIYGHADYYDCAVEYYDRVMIQFEDGDVFEIQGYDGEQYDDVFFVSVNHFFKQRETLENTKNDTVFGPFCYGEKVKGFIFKSKATNNDYSRMHHIGLELENNIVIWFVYMAQ